MPAVAEQTLVAPAHLWVPEHVSTSGPDAADLAESAGLVLDGEQRLAVDTLLAETASGQWAAFEAALIAARQNMKTVAFQAIALFKLFLLQDRLTVWTAHEFSTAIEAFRDIQALVDGAPHLSRKVRHVNNTNGEEGIELHSGARLIFRARSKRAGRGLSGNTVILDEAFALMPAHLGSLLPTLSAVPNSQVFYGSSAGHLYSAILRGVRDRGRAGGDPSLAYLEWCAPPGGCAATDCNHRLGAEGCALDDETKWQLANPALGRRLSYRALRAERRALAAAPGEFARERLGWWEDPVNDGDGDLDIEQWLKLADPDARLSRPVAFGVDVAEDRTACIAAAWRRRDRSIHVVMTQSETEDGRRIVDANLSPLVTPSRVVDLAKRWKGRVILGGPAAILEDDLRGVSTSVLTGTDFASACGRFDDLLRSGRIHHGNQEELNQAVRSARWRSVGTSGERAWRLKDAVGVGPLAAATRALAGLFNETTPPPAPVAVTTQPGSGLASMEF